METAAAEIDGRSPGAATGGAFGSAANLRTPGMALFTPPPNGSHAGVGYVIRGEREILFRVPFFQSVLPVVLLAIAFQAHFPAPS